MMWSIRVNLVAQADGTQLVTAEKRGLTTPLAARSTNVMAFSSKWLLKSLLAGYGKPLSRDNTADLRALDGFGLNDGARTFALFETAGALSVEAGASEAVLDVVVC
jgi:hypothetical protein